METGEFHNVDGWYYKRMEDGAVRIRKRATAHDEAPVVAEVTIPENEWASIVAHVTKSGETGESWQAALSASQDWHGLRSWHPDPEQPSMASRLTAASDSGTRNFHAK